MTHKMTLEEAKQQAIEYRARFQAGEITRKEAEKGIQPYKDLFNAKSAELAQKYNQKPQRFSMADFLRFRL